MAKAALENAVWDLEAQLREQSLWELLGGTRHHYSLRCLHRHPILAPEADGQDRHRTRRRISTHQAEVQTRLGHRHLRGRCASAGQTSLLSCDANSAYRMKDLDHITSLGPVQSAHDRAAPLVRRLLLPLHAAEASRDRHLSRRIHPQPPRRPGRNRYGVLPHHQHQSRPRRRLQRGDRRPQRCRRTWHPGLVRRHAGDRHRPLPQHRLVLAAELLAARRRLRLQPLLGPRHHRARGHRQPRRRDHRSQLPSARGFEVRRDRIEALTVRRQTSSPKPASPPDQSSPLPVAGVASSI